MNNPRTAKNENKKEKRRVRSEVSKEKESGNWKIDISDFQKNGCLVNGGD